MPLNDKYKNLLIIDATDNGKATELLKEEFIKHGDWNGINVTIPYKKEVMPYLDEISENAKKIGSVNTVVRRSDGTLFGDNTDYCGFYYTVKRSGINFGGKKVFRSMPYGKTAPHRRI